MKTDALVTIGVLNYNYAHFVIAALDSVAAQDYDNLQIIIVDDCSTDNSLSVINKWINEYTGVKKIEFVINKENMGLTKVSNLVLSRAKGKYFQLLDADDLLLPGKITAQAAILDANEKAAFIYSNAFVIDGRGYIIGTDYLDRIRYNKANMPSGSIFKDLLVFNFVSMPTVLVRTDLARQVGGFDEGLQVQDYYLWLQLAEGYEVLYHQTETAKYRVHQHSMSNHSASSPKSEESVISLKYRYYAQSCGALKKVIAKNIQNGSVYLYMHDHPRMNKWISIAFKLNPGLKTFGYLVASQFSIPYSFIKKIKKSLALG